MVSTDAARVLLRTVTSTTCADGPAMFTTAELKTNGFVGGASSWRRGNARPTNGVEMMPPGDAVATSPAVRVPAAVGVNVTVTVQDIPEGRPAASGQFSVNEKSPWFAPDSANVMTPVGSV